MHDAVIVGAGPNGLAAAVTLARAGLAVRVYEAGSEAGGGARTTEATLPGFRHDWGAAVHPMALASPFFRQFELSRRVRFHTPDASYAQAITPERSGIAWRDLDRTAAELGADGARWSALFEPLLRRAEPLVDFAMAPPLRGWRHPGTASRYATEIIRGAIPGLSGFGTGTASDMLAGVFAHSIRAPHALAAVAPGLMLAVLAHHHGWAIPAGGSQSITDELVRDLREHGGELVVNHRITSLAELPPSRVLFFDTDASQLQAIAGTHLSSRYVAALGRFRHGNAAAKVDFALSSPVPWKNPHLAHAGTVHVSGARADTRRAELSVARGQHAADPYILVSQPSLFDHTRAPAGAHVLWSYAHVPAGSTRDMTEAVTRRIEHFAPGFRDTIIGTAATSASDIAAGNPSMPFGDISGGALTLRQLLARPILSRSPWKASPSIYLCSAAAHPGPGVHGMGGFQAAAEALDHTFRRPVPPLGYNPREHA